MALSLRIRRALTLSSTILRDAHHFSPLSSSKPQSPLIAKPNPVPRGPHSLIQAQLFRSSPPSLNRRSDGFEDSKIAPDEILFEGCDYNHWLITIDFPKGDDKPTPEQMVETYVQTAAQIFGSVEEAKKRIYACSTTTYQGFQVLCDEATSEKFRGLPGVVFILPDSYIDPVNKEYGGDKYDNGVITHRPPPIQYGRQGRYGDRNRNYNRPSYDNSRSSVPPQQDGRGYGPPQQDGRGYGPPQQGGGGYGQGARGDFVPPGGQMPPSQGGFPQGQQGYPPRQEQANYSQGPRGDYGPPQQDGRGYGAPQQGGGGYGQGAHRDFVPPGGQVPPSQGGFPQGQQGYPPRQEQANYSQGPRGDYRSGPTGYRQPPPSYGGNYGPGSGHAGQTQPVPGPAGQTQPAPGPAGQTQPAPGYGGNYGQSSGNFGQGSGPGTAGEFGNAPGTGYNNDYRR